MIKCWHCAREVKVKSELFDVIPVSFIHGNKGWEIKGPGYFHGGMQCLLAYLYERWELWSHRGIENRFCKQAMLAVLEDYAKLVYGMDKLPPPALSRLLLEEYGGSLTWREWREMSWSKAPEWQKTNYAEIMSINHHRQFHQDQDQENRDAKHKVTILPLPLPASQVGVASLPGRTDVLLNFLTSLTT